MKKFPYQLYSIATLGDGSCFLHSILYCISDHYRKLDKVEKIKFVRELRNDLADSLPEYYSKLSRGKLKEISKVISETKLEKMQSFLRSREWFNQLYIEYVSDILDIDIYIVDYQKRELYNAGDDELFYKGRGSVIIGYYREAHFESLSLKKNNGENVTFFSPKSKMILELNSLLYTNRLNKDKN